MARSSPAATRRVAFHGDALPGGERRRVVDPPHLQVASGGSGPAGRPEQQRRVALQPSVAKPQVRGLLITVGSTGGAAGSVLAAFAVAYARNRSDVLSAHRPNQHPRSRPC
jgi:hypothetical protein